MNQELKKESVMSGKKSTMGRLAMVVFSVILVVCAFGVNFAFADEPAHKSGEWSYDYVGKDKASVVYYGSKTKMTVPNKVAGRTVVAATFVSGKIKKVDLSKAKSLTKFTVAYAPKLSSVNFEKALKLKEVWVYDEEMKKFNISKTKSLKQIYIMGPNITSLNISKNKGLKSLEISCAKLKKVDLSHNDKLESLTMGGNVSKLDFTKFKKLKVIAVSGLKQKSVDLSKNKALRSVFIYSNKNLSSMILPSSAPNLTVLNVSANKLTDIDVTPFANLRELDLANNQIKALDVSKNTELLELNFAFNPGLAVNVEGLPLSLEIEYSPKGKSQTVYLSDYAEWTTPTLPSLEFKNQ